VRPASLGLWSLVGSSFYAQIVTPFDRVRLLRLYSHLSSIQPFFSSAVFPATPPTFLLLSRLFCFSGRSPVFYFLMRSLPVHPWSASCLTFLVAASTASSRLSGSSGGPLTSPRWSYLLHRSWPISLFRVLSRIRPLFFGGLPWFCFRVSFRFFGMAIAVLRGCIQMFPLLYLGLFFQFKVFHARLPIISLGLCAGFFPPDIVDASANSLSDCLFCLLLNYFETCVRLCLSPPPA